MNLRSDMISYILSKTPINFGGRENWLGVKMSPHQSFEFINKVQQDGIITSITRYSWDECPDSVIQTIYQRLRLTTTNG